MCVNFIEAHLNSCSVSLIDKYPKFFYHNSGFRYEQFQTTRPVLYVLLHGGLQSEKLENFSVAWYN